MTNGTNNAPNYQLLKLYVDTIPHYNGDQNTLEIFINACDYLFRTYGCVAELTDYLLRVVLSKLTDRAQLLIASKTELRDWNSVKDALRLSFGDQRNLDCLEQDLITIYPTKNEQPLDFGKRIQVIRSHLSAKLNTISNTIISEATKLLYSNQYDNLALKTFIRGLSGHLQTVIRLRNPNSLEQAMCYVTEEENFKYTQSFANMLQNPFRRPIPINKKFANHTT